MDMEMRKIRKKE